MLDDLAVALGIDPDDPVQQRANHLVQQDMALLRRLREIRVEHGLSIEDVAGLMGVDAHAVLSLERYESDPTLSRLRRYAHAIGAVVEHHAQADPTWMRV